MPHPVSSICVFCAASVGRHSAYRAAATVLGSLLGERGHALVYGAGRTGLMGALAEAALAAGARVTGVVPESLNTPELVHQALSRLEVVPDLHVRKARMVALSDAFVSLPGGYGTLDELLDAVAHAQLRFHDKPVGVLNVDGYFDSLLEQLRRSVSDGFLTAGQLDLLEVAGAPAALLDRVEQSLRGAANPRVRSSSRD